MTGSTYPVSSSFSFLSKSPADCVCFFFASVPGLYGWFRFLYTVARGGKHMPYQGRTRMKKMFSNNKKEYHNEVNLGTPYIVYRYLYGVLRRYSVVSRVMRRSVKVRV